METNYINPKDAEWRISKDGYSIKSGYGDDEIKIAKYSGLTIETFFKADEFQVWHDGAERLCELHNGAINRNTTELQSLLDAKTKQFNALKISYDCKADIAAKLAPKYKAGEEAIATLESERQVNEQLTNLCERLETKNSELADALSDLVDCQNGCPLPSYEANWDEAMLKAKALLGQENSIFMEKACK